MRHDPDFTRAHPCTPLADYPPPSGGFCFSGYFSPKKLHEWRHESRTAHRASLPETCGFVEGLVSSADASGVHSHGAGVVIVRRSLSFGAGRASSRATNFL